MERKKIVVAMSGGVDSSVAAYLLKEEGHDVVGITMDLYPVNLKKCGEEGLRSCCGWKAVEDANRVAAALGVPHYVMDLRREFEKVVVNDFLDEYARGRTPNPCIRCNEHIKFKMLWRRAKRLGAEMMATGHHARVAQEGASGRYALLKGRDGKKDQSYFLYTLTQQELATTVFPVGDKVKSEVRRIASEMGLSVAEKPESQEVCFVPGRDYSQFFSDRLAGRLKPGPILDLEGRTMGHHRGIVHFTVGQRRGLGLSAPHPLYVLAIDADENAVVVGREEDLYRSALEASRVNWITGEGLSWPVRVRVKIRYKHEEALASLSSLPGGRLRVEFAEPQRAITPGQSVVFYDGDRVVGGAVIDKACAV